MLNLQDQLDRRRFMLKHAREEREELNKRIDRLVSELNGVKRTALEEGCDLDLKPCTV